MSPLAKSTRRVRQSIAVAACKSFAVGAACANALAPAFAAGTAGGPQHSADRYREVDDRCAGRVDRIDVAVHADRRGKAMS
jgi:hypothetical protein